ncbi:hypothetical protein [Sphingomonas desiccabilis]|uniref:Uncharacterized protein n=1 Tax=Sphingomonas desiccabilis TaxID=429134 RepID=A0A4Q2ITF3_9SPHN|nr:hypothetical protein [Sphingomonas desiccabilis]MBB3911571.1 hypothetical protein [Sphingomonas desiccabilis]RXZ31681.1 hypothetical protein EO081_10680 [Sphingomonas desiccabilis]
MGTRIKVLAACWIVASAVLLSGISQRIGGLADAGFLKEQVASVRNLTLSPSIEISVEVTLNLAR